MDDEQSTIRRVAVYCGSSGGVADHYRKAASDFGVRLARRGLGLVYGGGRVGLMGVVADAVLAQGGEVIGVIPYRLQELELGHEGASELIVAQTMAERKVKMQEMAQAVVALPGGPGTLDELFEEMVLTQLSYQNKPAGVLNVEGYFDHLLAFLDHVAAEGFVAAPFDRLLIHAADSDALLDKLIAYRGHEMSLEAKLRLAGRFPEESRDS